MDIKALTVTIKANTAEAETAMSRLEVSVDRILKKQELVAGRMSTMLCAYEDATRILGIANEQGPLITDLGYDGCEKDYNPTTKVYEPCTHRLSDMPDGLLKAPGDAGS